MITTKVMKQEVKWSREGIIELIDNRVRIDTSNGEYGSLYFDISLLKEKLIEHERKINESRINI